MALSLNFEADLLDAMSRAHLYCITTLNLPLGLQAPVMTPYGVIFLSFLSGVSLDTGSSIHA